MFVELPVTYNTGDCTDSINPAHVQRLSKSDVNAAHTLLTFSNGTTITVLLPRAEVHRKLSGVKPVFHCADERS